MLDIRITANDDGAIQQVNIFNHGHIVKKTALVGSVPSTSVTTDSYTKRFTDNNDGTITDHELGLQWSKDDASTKALKFSAAEKACKEFKLAGLSDWRLPTRKELASLVDDTKHKPAINTDYFPSCKSEYYWTQTPDASDPEVFAWIVNFHYGYVHINNLNLTACVRAVRSVSPPSQ